MRSAGGLKICSHIQAVTRRELSSRDDRHYEEQRYPYQRHDGARDYPAKATAGQDRPQDVEQAREHEDRW